MLFLFGISLYLTCSTSVLVCFQSSRNAEQSFREAVFFREDLGKVLRFVQGPSAEGSVAG